MATAQKKKMELRLSEYVFINLDLIMGNTPGGPAVSPVQKDLAIATATLMATFGDFKMGDRPLPPMINTALARDVHPHLVYGLRPYTIEGMHQDKILQPVDASPADFEWLLTATMQRVRHTLDFVCGLPDRKTGVAPTIHALLVAFIRGAGNEPTRSVYVTSLAPLFRMVNILVSTYGMAGVDEASFQHACELSAAWRVAAPPTPATNKPCVTYEVFKHPVDRATYNLAVEAVAAIDVPGVCVATFKMFPEPVWCLRWQGATWQHNGGCVKAMSRVFPAFRSWTRADADLARFAFLDEALIRLRYQLMEVPQGTQRHLELTEEINALKDKRGAPFVAANPVPDGSQEPVYVSCVV
jgi:hypothetical protein